uniref:Uncharacterized protein n=1 Tax=Rubinisphaera brasiliensis (strain ATCC 49424 / DSM 5305 / JCM 21570 / IAM 15109 / NBRC 103401 / IFAM 1448) TaxID=756272 RepID=F0SPH0_RUBBR|nr:hypothetical protein Plabr_0245 [Rubinisphaera brasiliensis DSM 5305]
MLSLKLRGKSIICVSNTVTLSDAPHSHWLESTVEAVWLPLDPLAIGEHVDGPRPPLCEYCPVDGIDGLVGGEPAFFASIPQRSSLRRTSP